MYYEITKNEVKTIEFENINLRNKTYGYIDFDEFKKIYKTLNIDDAIISECQNQNNHYKDMFEIYDDYSFGLISVKDSKDISKEKGVLGFLLKRGLLIIININSKDKEYVDGCIKNVFNKITINYELERIIDNVIEEILKGNFDQMEKYETNMIGIEKNLFKNKMYKDLNPIIFSIKKSLVKRKKYYEYLLNFVCNIKADENDIFDDTNLRYINNLEDKITRLINTAQYLIECTVHLRETYQSTLDFNQNKTVALLTVITTIFLPLSLIAGWYGMNFKFMPELNLRYAYPAVIILSGMIVVFILIFFKRKKII